MDENPSETHSFGQLVPNPPNQPSGLTSAPDQSAQRTDYLWTPSPKLIPFLPSNLEIPFVCLQVSGTRRFGPAETATSFCVQAALAGQAICESLGRLLPEQRANFNMMRLLFQLGSQQQERLHFALDVAVNRILLADHQSRRGPGRSEIGMKRGTNLGVLARVAGLTYGESAIDLSLRTRLPVSNIL